MSLYKGIIDFPPVAMLGSLLWVPRGLKLLDVRPQTIPPWSAFPQIPELLGSLGTQFPFASAVL